VHNPEKGRKEVIMVDFKCSYVSDYEFEPYPGDQDYDDPKSRENVKRAYDNMKLGRPIFISTALLKGPFHKGWTRIPLGEQSRAERRRYSRGVHSQLVPATSHQTQEAQRVPATLRPIHEAQPIPAISHQVQGAQPVPITSPQIQQVQPRLKRRKLSPSREQQAPVDTISREQDDQAAEVASVPQSKDDDQAYDPHPGLEAEEVVGDDQQEVERAAATSEERRMAKDMEIDIQARPQLETAHMSLPAVAPLTNRSSKMNGSYPANNTELTEDAPRHYGLEPEQSATAVPRSHYAENTDGTDLAQLADGSPTVEDLPIADPPAEILEAASKTPVVPMDVEFHLPTPSKALDEPAGNLDLPEEEVEDRGERPAETSPQSGLITPEESDETARPEPVMYIEDTFAETGPSGTSIDLEAPQVQPASPVLPPVHDEMDDIEEFTPAVNTKGDIHRTDHGSAGSPLAITNLPLLPVNLPVFGFTAVNSSMAQAAISPVPVAQPQSELATSPQAVARPLAAPTSKVIKLVIKNSAAVARKSCLECGITPKSGWRKGPAGSATLCSKCGSRWSYQEKKKKQAKTTSSKKTKPATKKLGPKKRVPALDLAPHLNDDAQSFGVLSPRKERPTRAAKPTYSMAIPSLLADSYDTTQDKPASEIRASARKRSLAFGLSPHHNVLEKMYGIDVLRTAMKVTNIDNLRRLLDDGFASHVTNRLELSSSHVQGTPRVTDSDVPDIALATPTDRQRRLKAKRIMTFDSPTSVKVPSKLRNKLTAGDAREVTAQKPQTAPQVANKSPVPQEVVQARPESPVVADAAEEEEIMVSTLTSPVELVERRNTSEDVQAPNQQTSISSSKIQSSQVGSPPPVEFVSTQALLQGGVDLSSSLLDTPAPPPGSALVTPAPGTTSAANTVLTRATPGSMGPPASIPRSSHSSRSEDAAPANTQAMFAEFGGLTDDSSPQSMHSARSRSSLHMSPTFDKLPLSPRHQHNDTATPVSFYQLGKRPVQALRSKFSPVMPDSAGGDSIFRFADITEVPSQAVEQSQADEDGEGLYDLDSIAQHGDSLLGLSQPHF